MFQDAISRCIHPSWCEGFCKTVQSCEGFRMSYFFIFQCKTGTARVEIHVCSSSCATVQPVSGWQFGCLESGQTVAAVVTMAGAEKCATGLISGWTTGRHLSWCDCIIISPTHHHMHHMLKLRIPHHSPLKSDIFSSPFIPFLHWLSMVAPLSGLETAGTSLWPTKSGVDDEDSPASSGLTNRWNILGNITMKTIWKSQWEKKMDGRCLEWPQSIWRFRKG